MADTLHPLWGEVLKRQARPTKPVAAVAPAGGEVDLPVVEVPDLVGDYLARPSVTDGQAGIKASTEASLRSAARAEEATFGTLLEFGIADAPGNRIWSAILRPEYEPDGLPLEDFEKELSKKMTPEDQEEYLAAGSRQARQVLLGEFERKREANELASYAGGLKSFTAMALGGMVDPTAFLLTAGVGTGLNAIRGGVYGARAAAMAGQYGRAVGINVAEGAGTEALLEGTAQFMERKADPATVAVNALFGGLFGVPGAIMDVGAGVRNANLLRQLDEQRARAFDMGLDTYRRAREKAGEGASDEQVVEAAMELERQANTAAAQGTVAPGKSRIQFQEEPVDLLGGIEGAEATPITRPEAPEAAPAANRLPTMEERLAQSDRMVGGNQGTVGKAARGAGFKSLSEIANSTDRIINRTAQNFPHEMETIRRLLPYLDPNAKVVFTDSPLGLQGVAGAAWTARPERYGQAAPIHFIHMNPTRPSTRAHTLVHEFGHLVVNDNLPRVSAKMRADLDAALAEFAAAGDKALRYSQLNENLYIEGDAATPKGLTAEQEAQYRNSLDEMGAEQFVRFIQSRVAEGNPDEIPAGFVAALQRLWAALRKMFITAKATGDIGPDARWDEFFKQALARRDYDGPVAEAPAAGVATGNLTDPIAAKYALTEMNKGTDAEKADYVAILRMYREADQWAQEHPLDDAWKARAESWVSGLPFDSVKTPARNLLMSENPLARMVATELLEDPSGISGERNLTAAVQKYMAERIYLGNSLTEIQSAYGVWRGLNGGSLYGDLQGGKTFQQFNDLVFAEIESRRGGARSVTTDPHVMRAADAAEAAFERMRQSQVDTKTLGWGALPATSRGYVPHRIPPAKLMALTDAERRAVNAAMVDQFVGDMGFDFSFAQELADRYLNRVQERANGGMNFEMPLSNPGNSEILRDALVAAGMDEAQIKESLKRFTRGAANHTKKRLGLDLLKEYNGVRLIDVFETNVMELIRGQARRVSGEVALAKHGVYGRPGLLLIDKALQQGGANYRTSPQALESWRLVAGEFLGESMDVDTPWLEGARTLTSVVRLGGIAFNQFAEYINVFAHVGAEAGFRAMNIPGLRRQILDKLQGKPGSNPFLDSLEELTGEIGTENYRTVFPFDTPDRADVTGPGQNTHVVTRALRGLGHLHSKLSGLRVMQGVQERGAAQGILIRASKAARDGKNTAFLKGMGIDDGMLIAIRESGAASFDSSGTASGFDIRKLPLAYQEALAVAVTRGTKQMIQGTFIGETGAWRHNGWAKVLLQFKSFGLIAWEKQWNRSKNTVGGYRAAMMFLGAMSVAAPLHMARVYIQAQGRDDQEEYLERRLAPAAIGRATLNYIAQSGLAGDFLDAMTATMPDSVKAVIGEPTGGRYGGGQSFFGNIAGPAIGYVDSGWKAVQNLDPQQAARLVPGSNLPYVQPFINAAFSQE